MTVVINGTTGITNVNGSAAAPAETGTDTDTGIYYGTNTVGLATNGTSALFVDASQNVGVGTASPAYKLDVNGVVKNTGAFRSISGSVDGIFGAGQFASGVVGLGSVSNHPLTFNTNLTEYMRIDTSGNVGIGTSSPASKLDARTSGNGGISGPSTGTWTARVVHNNDASGGNGLSVQNRWASTNSIIFECAMGWNGTATGYYPVFTVDGLGQCIWANNSPATERMRLDTSGNLLVGSNAPIVGYTQVSVTGSSTNRGALIMGRATAATTGVAGTLVAYNGSSPVCGFDFQSNGANNSGYIQSYTYSAGSFVAGPYLNTGGTSWTTSSDEALKDVIEPISSGVEKLSDLRTVIGKYKTDPEGTRRVFMIAQDVQKVLPEAVNKDSNGYLGLNYQDLIPVLVKAIQELKTQNDELRARVAALEGAK